MIGKLGITHVCVKIHIDKVPSIWRIIKCDMRGKSTFIHMHFVRDVIEPKEIVMEKVASEENSTIVFTKSLPRSRCKHCLELINFVEE